MRERKEQIVWIKMASRGTQKERIRREKRQREKGIWGTGGMYRWVRLRRESRQKNKREEEEEKAKERRGRKRASHVVFPAGFPLQRLDAKHSFR